MHATDEFSSTKRRSWIRVPKPLALEDVEEGDWNSTDQDEYYCDKLYLEVKRFGAAVKAQEG